MLVFQQQNRHIIGQVTIIPKSEWSWQPLGPLLQVKLLAGYIISAGRACCTVTERVTYKIRLNLKELRECPANLRYDQWWGPFLGKDSLAITKKFGASGLSRWKFPKNIFLTDSSPRYISLQKKCCICMSIKRMLGNIYIFLWLDLLQMLGKYKYKFSQIMVRLWFSMVQSVKKITVQTNPSMGYMVEKCSCKLQFSPSPS